MTMDELQEAILEICPNAIFDKEFSTGEIVIATGFTLEKGMVVKMPGL
jgi:hypothetical protein